MTEVTMRRLLFSAESLDEGDGAEVAADVALPEVVEPTGHVALVVPGFDFPQRVVERRLEPVVAYRAPTPKVSDRLVRNGPGSHVVEDDVVVEVREGHGVGAIG